MSIQEIADRDGISYAAAKQKAYRERRKGNAGNGNKGNGNALPVTSGNGSNALELWAEIDRLKIENATLRADLFAAHQELRELRQVELPVARGPVIVPFDDI